MISFTCPACGHAGPVRPEFAGRKVKCPACQAPAHVPAEAAFSLWDSTPRPLSLAEAEEGPAPGGLPLPIKIGLGLCLLAAAILAVAALGVHAGDAGWFGAAFGIVLIVATLYLLPIIGAYFSGRDRTCGPAVAVLLAFLLGFVGFLIVLCFPRVEPVRKCPHCAETILQAARVCRFCARAV